ncbi:hypothetical protein QF036_002157 [Arthrobacter globiformis]|nr:hypothetical protein [Arthrobacter globiformis]
MLDVVAHRRAGPGGITVPDGLEDGLMLPMILFDRVRVIHEVSRRKELATGLPDGFRKPSAPGRPADGVVKFGVRKSEFSPIQGIGLLANRCLHFVQVFLRAALGSKISCVGLERNAHSGEVIKFVLLLKHIASPFCERLTQSRDESPPSFTPAGCDVTGLLKVFQSFAKAHASHPKRFGQFSLRRKSIARPQLPTSDEPLDVIRDALRDGNRRDLIRHRSHLKANRGTS